MNTKAEYLPFHAINEFMRPDFRLSLIKEILSALPGLGEKHNSRINHLLKNLIKVPGFRNSDKAPTLMKTLPTSKAFEKSPELVAAMLSAWADMNTDLRDRVFTLLKLRGWYLLPENQTISIEMLSTDQLKKWPVLPPEADRVNLPGFYIYWPNGEDYESMYKQFSQDNPDYEASIDKVSLMIIWLSLRLPYHMEDEVGEASNKA